MLSDRLAVILELNVLRPMVTGTTPPRTIPGTTESSWPWARLTTVNLRPQTLRQLAASAGWHELALPITVLNLGLKQQGVGGNNRWGAWSHEPDLIRCQPQGYSFRLRLVGASDKFAKLGRSRVAPANGN